MRKFGPYKILKNVTVVLPLKLNCPKDMDISFVIYISKIFEHHKYNEETIVLLDYPKKKIEGIDNILDTTIRKSTKGKGYKEYLV